MLFKPVTEAKRKVLLAYKQNPCPGTRDALTAARSKAQQTARHCANEYWQNLCANIQAAADSGHSKGMYEGIKTATGPNCVKTVPLRAKTGEVITDQSKQLQRWVVHYLELYSTQNIVTDAALGALHDLPVMEKLDEKPTLEELSKAIDCLSCGKAPGKDGIPPEVLKHGKAAVLQPLHDLLCLCWEQGHIPQGHHPEHRHRRCPRRLAQGWARLPFQDRAPQPFKTLCPSTALHHRLSRRGCHYHSRTLPHHTPLNLLVCF